MASKQIEKIIAKYLVNQASFEELDDLELWVTKPENEQEFINYVKVNYTIDYNLKRTNTIKTKNLITNLIKEEKRRLKRRRILNYTQYAAVLVIGLSIIGYLFKDFLFSNSVDNEVIPEIVNTNTIDPGTDKATLTLEDGSQISLERGASIQTQNANSNGEEIVYEAGERNSKEIVYNYLTIPRGGQFFVKLSDGTQVWLNSESQLKYPVAFLDGIDREVELVYGEAYFDVSPSTLHKGSKFKVVNNSQEIEVLGTEFNIKAYQDEDFIYTTLVEGKVSVNVGDKIYGLEPNQQSGLNVTTKKLSVQKVDVYNEISWKDGVFVFEGKPLKEIMKVLSRWYNVDFTFENREAQERKFNGSVKKSARISEILDIIKAFGVITNYEVTKDKIILK